MLGVNITLLGLALFLLPGSDAQCPRGASNTRTYRGRCYDQIYINLNWANAKAYCERAPNGKLLQMTSSSIRSYLRYWFSRSPSWSAVYTNNSVSSMQTPAPSSEGNSNGTGVTTTATMRTTFMLNPEAKWYWSDPQGDRQITSRYSLFWGTGEPSRTRGGCVTVAYYGYYKTENCQSLRQFTCEYGCESHINDGNETTITSPNYPSYYGSNANCEWFINVGEGKAVLRFNTFNTQQSGSYSYCRNDYLEVYERKGGRRIKQLCGTALPSQIVSPSQYLYLRFKSDYSYTRKGFQATVRSSTVPLIYTLNHPHGIITTTDFPLNYTNNAAISWRISVPRGSVNLKFTEFDVESGTTSGNCDTDKLTIRESSASGKVLGTYCGTNIPPNITASSLYLTFTSDVNITKPGFRAIYWSSAEDCVNIISESSGVITSPGYPVLYHPNLRCVWYIDVGGGIVRMNFTDVRIDYSSSCLQDRLEVWDGRVSNGTRIGSYCGSSKPRSITSKSRYITLFFQTNAYESEQGFRAVFRSSWNCSKTIFGQSGGITSPNYPSYYDPYVNCTWIIGVPNGTVNIKFTRFSVQFHQFCLYDHIEIFDGNSTDAPKLGKFCGSKKPPAIRGTGSQILVRMTTNEKIGGAGFAADFWSSEMQCEKFRMLTNTLMNYNGICYGFVKQKSYSWLTARDSCESANTSLIYFDSRSEFNAIKKWIYDDMKVISDSSGAIWTGGYLRVGRSAWFWSRAAGDTEFGKHIASDHLWGAGEPSPRDKYVRMTSGGLQGMPSSSGSAYVLCKQDVEGDKQIKPVDGCSAPPNIQSGYYSPPKSFYSHNSAITYHCDPYHKLVGKPLLSCLNGRWQGSTPHCTKTRNIPSDDYWKSCRRHPTVKYAVPKPQRSLYDNGSVLHFDCYSGFTLKPAGKAMVCLSGLWQGVVPSCVSLKESGDSSQGGQKGGDAGRYSGILGGTITVIVILTLIIIAGIAWLVIQRSRRNSRERLMEMN